MTIYIKSPSVKADFSEFQKNYNPDLEETLDWIAANLDTGKVFEVQYNYPDDIFSYDQLCDWAGKNNFVEENAGVDSGEVENLIDAIAALQEFFQ